MLTRLFGALVLVVTLTGCITISQTTVQTATPSSQRQSQPSTKPPASTPTAKPSTTSTQATATSPAGTPGATNSPTSSSAGSPSATASSGTSGRPTFATVDDAYSQPARAWQSCHPQGAPAQCGTIYVPTDYANPSAGTTAIAVARFPSTGVSKGDLFINPGGPGAGGIDFAAYLASYAAPALAANFDIVGFDPRGTGKSDPITCLGTAALDTLNAFDPTPEDAQERQQGIDLVNAQGAACETNTGLLADHVSTIETARDIDILRGVLGDDKTNYFGFSYGTFLGTTYAALFPDKVGRMVLDGALIPNTNSFTASEMQTKGLQTEFDAYIAQCIKQAACPLGTTASAASDKLRKLLVDVDTNPLQTGDPQRPLTQALAFYGIVDTMYSPNSWPGLTNALTAAFQGDGFPLLALSDDYFQRNTNGYASNEIQANQDINCLDEQVAGGPTPIPESTFVADSPIAGDIMFGFADRGCGQWPLKTTLTPPDYSAPGTPPILVVGTTRDPATPYVWAQELAKLLSKGELLTRVGDGHTAYISGNPCIVSAVDAFFIDGTDVPPGTTC